MMFDKLQSTLKRSPEGTEEVVFEFASLSASSLCSLPIIKQFIEFFIGAITLLFQAISPAMSFNIRPNNNNKNDMSVYRVVFAYAFPMTIFFCLGLNAFLTWQVGTFFPANNPGTIHFLDDVHNIVLYTVICPFYVSLSVCLFVTTILHWRTLNRHSNIASKHKRSFAPKNNVRVALFMGISLLISGLFIANYIQDLRNPELTTDLYWFFNQAKSGERLLNAAGAYYLFLNAVLLFTTSIAALSYITMSIEAFRLGSHIDKSNFALDFKNDPDNFTKKLKNKDEKLRIELGNFSLCYIWTKSLVLVYALNILIWQISPAGQVSNVHAAILVVLVVGIFFLTIPRLYLGSKWHHFKWGQLDLADEATDEKFQEIEYADIRTKTIKKISGLLNLVYASIIAVVLNEQYGWSGITDSLTQIFAQ